MKKNGLLFIIAVLAFNFLFWQEHMGVNLLLFHILTTGILFLTERESFNKPIVKWVTLGTLWAAIMVVGVNTLFCKTIYCLSFMSWVGFVHERHLRLPMYALLQSISSLFTLPSQAVLQFVKSKSNHASGFNWKTFWRYCRLTILPLFGFFIFHELYTLANPQFDQVTHKIWSGFNFLFDWNVSAARLWFVFLSLLVVGFIFNPSRNMHLSWIEHQHQEQKRRLRTPLKIHSLWQGLKRHYQSGVLMLGALNLLLFLANATDFWYVWLGQTPVEAALLKQFVHTGTYILIFAIILAMGILLFYFKGQMHFLSENGLLKKLAHGWIIQNAFMVLSVFIRNLKYIDTCGLAYKRVGVIVFLLMVCFGLWTMFQKIKTGKTIYYLLLKNSWAAYAILLIVASVNWDTIITRYNLTKIDNSYLDAHFLCHGISDKNLYLLKKHQGDIAQKIEQQGENVNLADILSIKQNKFETKLSDISWKSWNYPDHRNRRFIKSFKVDGE